MDLDERLQVIYILESTELAGGIKVVFEQAHRLIQSGVNAAIFSLDRSPLWFKGNVPVETFPDYQALGLQLRSFRIPKIATLWRTAPVVAENSQPGEGFYLVQDIETNFYTDQNIKNSVLQTYDLPLTRMTTSRWVEKALTKMGRQCYYVGIGIDHDVFYVDPQFHRQQDVILVNAPRNRRLWYIKGMDTLIQVLRTIRAKRPNIKIISFSPEPSPLDIPEGPYVHYQHPKDEELAILYRTATCFLMTSLHEGFYLPSLEAMACGCPVVATKAGGNEEYCLDGDSCVLVDTDKVDDMAEAAIALLEDQERSHHLSVRGVQIARRYTWSPVMTSLLHVLGIQS